MLRSCQGLPERSFRQYHDCRILEGHREKGELRELCENEYFFFLNFCGALQNDWGVFFFFLFLKRVGVTLEQAVMDHNYGVVILNKVNGSDPQTIGSQVTPSKSTVELFLL